MSERLEDNTAVSLILRLLLNGEGQIVSGEVGSMASTGGHQKWLRFRGSVGLIEAIGSLARAELAERNTDTG